MPGDFEHSTLRPKGHIIVTSDAGVTEADTLQCAHCGRHWTVQPGSGRKRGWCFKCGSVTCGAPGCIECLPAEKRLDLYEKGTLLRL